MAYLDHAATTPMVPAAVEAVTAQLGRVGNPSALHAAGRAARRVVEQAREQIAAIYGAAPVEVVFTSGGTESNNLALQGLYRARRAGDDRRRRVIVSAVEHPAVLATARGLARWHGAQLALLPVDGQGAVDPQALRELIAPDPASVAVVSVMWANNEVGTIQPVAELAEICREYGVPFHTDAVQAAGWVPVDFAGSGVAALTITAHKIGGPVGTGALLLSRTAAVEPVLYGGGQERDLRSGTVDVAGVAGFAAAAGYAAAMREAAAVRLVRLRDALIAGVRRAVPDVVVSAAGAPRLAGIAHLAFPGCEADALLMLLDEAGVRCSTGSACTAGVARPSHVLEAMGVGDGLARAALRFSLGHTSTADDVAAVVAAIGPAVARARRRGARLAEVIG